MSDRFYVQGEWNESVTLTGSEAQHLSKVLRKQVGDSVELFDGRGWSANAIVKEVSRREVELTLETEPTQSAIPKYKLVLAVAPPKGDRFRWLIEKATELGVHAVIPVQTERSVVRPGETKLEKLHQTMIAACKQCGRNQFMEIGAPTTLAQLCESHNPRQAAYFGAIPAPEQTETPRVSSAETTLFIGPEGGFSDEEINSLLSINAQPISVSPYVLRVETASIAVISVLSHSFGRQL